MQPHATLRRVLTEIILTTPTLVRGLLGTDPPNPTLESASPSPPQGSISHRNRVKSGNRGQINVESMMPYEPSLLGVGVVLNLLTYKVL